MNEPPADNSVSLSTKIARLVRERGWNQDEFARIAGLNRQTVRQILNESPRTLRNSTVSACARALGVSVNDLLILPLEKLLTKSSASAAAPAASPLLSLRERAVQPELIAWIERNPERAAQLEPHEIEELLGLQDESGGVFVSFGVEKFVEMIERRRRLVEQVTTIAGTEYLDLLEKIVNLIHEKVQPYRDRV